MCVTNKQVKKITEFSEKGVKGDTGNFLYYLIKKTVVHDEDNKFNPPYKFGVSAVLYNGRVSPVAWSREIDI